MPNPKNLASQADHGNPGQSRSEREDGEEEPIFFEIRFFDVESQSEFREKRIKIQKQGPNSIEKA